MSIRHGCVLFVFSSGGWKSLLYVVIAAIVIALLAVSAVAMVWDPRRRTELDEYEYEYGMDGDDAAPDEYARSRNVEWPRKESV
ncbi:hypothetical protein IU427_32220 [Nocardia beijingensis]|nr:hypothetical protein [Nocardia beijingensis]